MSVFRLLGTTRAVAGVRVAGLSVAALILNAASAPGQVATGAARPAASRAIQSAPTSPFSVDSQWFASMRWRELGPARGGRSVAVAGSAQRPLEYWMGTTGGGVYKTTDGGINWQPTTDKYFSGTIGAIT